MTKSSTLKTMKTQSKKTQDFQANLSIKKKSDI